MAVYTERGKGLENPQYQIDAALNDSDKSLTVPAGHIWFLQLIHAELSTTATVGNRQVRFEILDPSAVVVWAKDAGATPQTQAASLTYNYMAAADLEDTDVSAALEVFNKILRWGLLEGWSLRIYDSAAVDAAADDLTLHVLVDDQIITLYE